MDVLIETIIGDAQISLKGGRHNPGAKRDLERAAAFPASGVPQAAEIETFLAPLRGLDLTDLDLLVKRLPMLALPSGYRHFRLFNGDTGQLWSSMFVVEEGRALTLHDALFSALNHPVCELATWTTSEWLPDMISGVLDIELTFVAVPRTKKPFRLKL